MSALRARFLCIGLAITIGLSIHACTWLAGEPNYSRIERDLYMGGRVSRPPPGTKVVVNLCEAPDTYHADEHLWEPIRDAEPAPSIVWLRQMVQVVDEAQRRQQRTYVHCAAGISRSGMVIVAYEMFKNHWSRDEALAFVRSHRPAVRPNAAFMQLLLEWERELGETAGDPYHDQHE